MPVGQRHRSLGSLADIRCFEARRAERSGSHGCPGLQRSCRAHARLPWGATSAQVQSARQKHGRRHRSFSVASCCRPGWAETTTPGVLVTGRLGRACRDHAGHRDNPGQKAGACRPMPCSGPLKRASERRCRTGNADWRQSDQVRERGKLNRAAFILAVGRSNKWLQIRHSTVARIVAFGP
jgi:hypothetical protein